MIVILGRHNQLGIPTRLPSSSRGREGGWSSTGFAVVSRQTIPATVEHLPARSIEKLGSDGQLCLDEACASHACCQSCKNETKWYT